MNFISQMLQDRSTMLKFDGYILDPINIDNRIRQGDLLSMVLYQFYNTNLLVIPRGKNEDTVAYIDNTIMVATAKSSVEVLLSMICREGEVLDWSKNHNSLLEISKLTLIDSAHRSSCKERAILQLPQRIIEPSSSAKYLGIIVDQNLNWKAQ